MASKESEDENTDTSLMPQEYAIIQEIYDIGDAEQIFEDQLENALEGEAPYIIIEPIRVGDETVKWIQLGNCIHKTAVLAGLGCLISPWVLPRVITDFVSIPLGGLSLACAGLYGVSWQFDPCCKYQVEYDIRELEKIHTHRLTTLSPVVLVRKDDIYRKRFHNFTAACVTLYFGWKMYKMYIS